MEGFVNGYLVFQKTGMILLKTDDIGFGINTVWWRHFWGGGGPPLRKEWSVFDDIVMWIYDADENVVRGNNTWPEGTILTLPPAAGISKTNL
jgi:hypothetical protein